MSREHHFKSMEDVQRHLQERKSTMSGLYETTEQSMIEAHKAGMKYWRINRPYSATGEDLSSLARACGWHGEDNAAWLAGFFKAKARSMKPTTRTLPVSLLAGVFLLRR